MTPMSERFVRLGFIIIPLVMGLFCLSQAYLTELVPARALKQTIENLAEGNATAEGYVVGTEYRVRRGTNERRGPFYLTYSFEAPDRFGNRRSFEKEQEVDEEIIARYGKFGERIPIVYYPPDPNFSALQGYDLANLYSAKMRGAVLAGVIGLVLMLGPIIAGIIMGSTGKRKPKARPLTPQRAEEIAGGQLLRISNPMLRDLLQKAQRRGGKLAPYLEEIDGELYLAFDFIQQPEHREAGRDLISRFNENQPVDNRALSALLRYMEVIK